MRTPFTVGTAGSGVLGVFLEPSLNLPSPGKYRTQLQPGLTKHHSFNCEYGLQWGGGEGGIDGYLVGKKSEFVKVGYDNRKILR